MQAKQKRQINQSNAYDRYFPTADMRTKTLSGGIEVEDTLEFIKKIIADTLSDTKRIAQKLEARTIEETASNIWHFVYENIQYKKDKPGYEQIRRPSRTWAERKSGVDCDCYTVFIGSILQNLGIEFRMRVTAYGGDWQHIYPIVIDKNAPKGYWVIDCVVDEFDYEVTYTRKKDYSMATQYLSGIDDVYDDFEELEDDYVLEGIDDNVALNLATAGELGSAWRRTPQPRRNPNWRNTNSNINRNTLKDGYGLWAGAKVGGNRQRRRNPFIHAMNGDGGIQLRSIYRAISTINNVNHAMQGLNWIREAYAYNPQLFHNTFIKVSNNPQQAPRGFEYNLFFAKIHPAFNPASPMDTPPELTSFQRNRAEKWQRKMKELTLSGLGFLKRNPERKAQRQQRRETRKATRSAVRAGTMTRKDARQARRTAKKSGNIALDVVRSPVVSNLENWKRFLTAAGNNTAYQNLIRTAYRAERTRFTNLLLKGNSPFKQAYDSFVKKSKFELNPKPTSKRAVRRANRQTKREVRKTNRAAVRAGTMTRKDARAANRTTRKNVRTATRSGSIFQRPTPRPIPPSSPTKNIPLPTSTSTNSSRPTSRVSLPVSKLQTPNISQMRPNLTVTNPVTSPAFNPKEGESGWGTEKGTWADTDMQHRDLDVPDMSPLLQQSEGDFPDMTALSDEEIAAMNMNEEGIDDFDADADTEGFDIKQFYQDNKTPILVGAGVLAVGAVALIAMKSGGGASTSKPKPKNKIPPRSRTPQNKKKKLNGLNGNFQTVKLA